MEQGTRNKIINAASELFSSKGFKATTMGDIAAHVGVTKAALYYFFDNKEALYGAIIDEALGEACDRLTETARRSESLTGVIETLIAVGIGMGTSFRAIEPGALDHCSAVRTQIARRFEDLRRLVVDSIARNGIPDAEIAAEVTLNAVHAYVMHAQCGIARIDHRAYAGYLTTLLGHTKKTQHTNGISTI